MASVTQVSKGKYRVIVSNGFKANGERNRITKTIKAKNITEAKKVAENLAMEFKRKDVKECKNWTFNQLVEEWQSIKKAELAPKTAVRYEQIIKSSLLPKFERTKVSEITVLDVNRYMSSLNADGIRRDGKVGGYSPQTQKHYYSLLRTLLNFAVKWEVIESNPCKKVDAPKVYKVEAKHYEDEDIKKLLSVIENEELKYKVFLHIALSSGCRKSEILGMEWKDIDFEKGTVWIRRSSQDVKGMGVITREMTKTISSKRNIMLPKSTIELLEEYKIEQDKQKEKMGEKWEEHNRLFTQKDGKPMHPGTPYNRLRKLIKKHNLKYINIHGFRHTHVSVLINSGMDIVGVSRRVGHADITTTLNRYAHLMNKVDCECANVLERFYQNTDI